MESAEPLRPASTLCNRALPVERRGDGTITVTSQPLPDALPSILLQQGAQQDLHSLINIVAVNSQINVLLNLNISINSTIGNLTQLNFTTKP